MLTRCRDGAPAIGIVVDDAIVVVEAVIGRIEHGEIVTGDAPVQAMKQVSVLVMANAHTPSARVRSALLCWAASQDGCTSKSP